MRSDEAAAPGVRGAYDPALDPDLRMGGIALKNGLVLVSERNWAAAIREADGSISVASGRKPRLPGTGGPSADAQRAGGAAGRTDHTAGPRAAAQRAATGSAAGPATGRPGATQRPGAAGRTRTARDGMSPGLPLVRGLGRFGETLMVLGIVKSRLPNAGLPFEGGRVAAALAASAAATSAVRAAAPRSAFVQEAGSALAAFIPAVLAVKNSAISGYHGAEHKVIGAREAALRAAAGYRGASAPRRRLGAGAATEAAGATAGAPKAEAGVPDVAGAVPGTAAGPDAGPDAGAAPGVTTSGVEFAAAAKRDLTLTGDSETAAKEHDRCGTNLMGPYLFATVLTNLLARGKSGQKTPASSALAGAASLALALEALRWASRHGDSVLARLILMPGKAIQRRLTTTEPSAEQLEVGRRALEELLRLEGAGA